mgnify:FL=1
MEKCRHKNTALGYYKHPDKNVMIEYCSECYQEKHPFKTGPFITRYGQKLLEGIEQKPSYSGQLPC